jgi:hypothetical protein
MKSPCLCPETVADDDALALVIDRMLLGSKKIRKLGRRVRRTQERLRRAVDERSWWVYMQLEEIVNHRVAVEGEALVRWAYEAGRRSR